MARKYLQGKFVPKNPKKYKGDASKIFYRSSWELKVMLKLDERPEIIAWNSEDVVIPYVSPIDGKVHRYFCDLVFQKENQEGKRSIHLVEIKPFAQTIEPKRGNKKINTYLTEVKTYGVNQAKWKAAREHCKKMGWEFHIITEKHLKSMLVG